MRQLYVNLLAGLGGQEGKLAPAHNIGKGSQKRNRSASRKIANSNKEKQIWVIKEKETKAKRSNRKRPSLVQKKNEN